MLAKGSGTWISTTAVMSVVFGAMLFMYSDPPRLDIPHVWIFLHPGFWFVFWMFATGFLAIFFRDPERAGPSGGMLCPADGVVMKERGDRTVRIFMNVHNVHVNRAPLSGRVVELDHRPGGLSPAFTKDSDLNERVRIVLDTQHGEVVVTQIAGTLARRIVPYIMPGDRVRRGQRIGIIRLGSRVDVSVPDGFDIVVKGGQKVLAGVTVVARESAGRRRRRGRTAGGKAGASGPRAPAGRGEAAGEETAQVRGDNLPEGPGDDGGAKVVARLRSGESKDPRDREAAGRRRPRMIRRTR